MCGCVCGVCVRVCMCVCVCVLCVLCGVRVLCMLRFRSSRILIDHVSSTAVEDSVEILLLTRSVLPGLFQRLSMCGMCGVAAFVCVCAELVR